MKQIMQRSKKIEKNPMVKLTECEMHNQKRKKK